MNLRAASPADLATFSFLLWVGSRSKRQQRARGCRGVRQSPSATRWASDRGHRRAVGHVPTSGGLVNPAAEIGRIARAADTLFLLDATQSVGQFPIDVETIGCDLLSGTGRKFLRGPRGTGFLWVHGAAIDRLDPFVAEIRSATWDGDRGFTWAEGARRFESWENSYVNILGLRAAVRQALDLGLEAIAERSASLGAQLRDRLDALPGVRTHDLGETRCAIGRQRHHHRPRAHPIRYRGPRCAPPGPVLTALLQHRGRTRTGRAIDHRPDPVNPWQEPMPEDGTVRTRKARSDGSTYIVTEDATPVHARHPPTGCITS